ncbi:MAG: rod shape-determining protein MreD [Alphaproteobacteria bacterium]|nr:rod shape-determining protein MreD [Alphaproteobacteria bacterium]
MDSNSQFLESVRSLGRKILVYGFILLLLILNVTALPSPFSGNVKLPLVLTALYYWAVYRPTLVPVGGAFILGLLMDLLGGFPLGLNALIFTVVHWLATSQRRFLTAQSFFIVWLGFMVVHGGALIFQIFIFGIGRSHFPPLSLVGIQWIAGVTLFPLLCILLHLTHRLLPSGSGHSRPKV